MQKGMMTAQARERWIGRKRVCPFCYGKGNRNDEFCYPCYGTGEIEPKCSGCEGSGRTWEGKCRSCNGTGKINYAY